ncbi:MAG: hypothetical protein K2X69_07065 [Silvanigrellaceae bacterium]|nr:hypothetical protein [Silvanigrellaceae bacterium]
MTVQVTRKLIKEEIFDYLKKLFNKVKLRINYLRSFDTKETYPIVSILTNPEKTSKDIFPYGTERNVLLKVLIFNKYPINDLDGWELTEDITELIENEMASFISPNFKIQYEGMEYDTSEKVSSSLCEIMTLNYLVTYEFHPVPWEDFEELKLPKLEIQLNNKDKDNKNGFV